jgi:histidine triad (HIT) family protein
MSDCLFCKIVAGEIPATPVAETEDYLAFRDISPQAPTHADDGALLGGLVLFARDVARDEGLADDGYRVVINTNAGAGQTVFHIHAHLLGGRPMTWPPG